MRILLYADVDLNLIDGSSIWLASLAETLSLEPSLSVDVLSRTRLRRETVVCGLRARSNVRIIDPWALEEEHPLLGRLQSLRLRARLSPSAASKLIRELDFRYSYDLIVVRDDATAVLILKDVLLKRRLWVYVCNPRRYQTPDQLSRLGCLAFGAARLFTQTDLTKRELLERVPGLPERAVSLMPPMIPDIASPSARFPDQQRPKLVYCGKFSPPYNILEMLSAFRSIRARFEGAEFHVLGDKFYNYPPIKGFGRKVRNVLENSPGVRWYGGVSRDRTDEVLSRVDIASSWRHPSFDSSGELSTKVLEYAAHALPVLMNKNPLQQQLFGSSYPGFVQSERDFVETFGSLISNSDLYQDLASRLWRIAQPFTFPKALDRLMPFLQEFRRSTVSVELLSNNEMPKRILFAGHNFHFAQPLIEHYRHRPGYLVSVDQWTSHDSHDRAGSRRLLASADVIFCEWCLGNAVWYSKRKRSNQRLIIRLHNQEMKLKYLPKLKWENIDSLIAICPRNYDALQARFPDYSSRIALVYNLFETATFNKPKVKGAEFNLGFMGLVPMRKRPDLAFRILSALRKRDSRFTLHFLGKLPEDYPWMRRRFKELRYYRRLMQDIEVSPHRNSVVFDDFTSDVPGWFTKIGFLLSTSDLEGSHQAVAEGMAAGSIPVIRSWTGAERLYPREYVFTSLDGAVERILKMMPTKRYWKLSRSCQTYSQATFDCHAILPWIEKVVEGSTKQSPDRVTPGEDRRPE